ncbi:GFA family protein [Ketogulonicigenium vulgare]|uniref:Glutathione-dependent formaldehyde-activating, GFA n=1 Tax=Ketogulonicigenium vulgare (strain WSH-001) TaxID=759362 RepID=F9Y974_KETVW|nr:GFA family protein [Ketogulonicigenium vulgare]ADO41585.1 glutathione-dependent formaldehyde-activating, GFA [Ketogulonicigenium vulgare Y25]AEM41291.1 Glutathione-dependent formaldehyde-activating, GFA [Ketogulonicigenium vulgare WSH-001]ALJ81427.1 aldehyde-activating protein [Ketogulonicigenium vulgare]ANW34147.1 aldehyde-activating protein [Ketogulonicigenium vulgare]AOZ55024.1 glutathione-dependent formaldehyde-activating, GFA [Ketogulonicigenium vulgare]
MTTAHYTGSCQCGAIAYTVDADLDSTVTCNCSRCKRLGSVMTFVPASAFHLTKDGPVTSYKFNKLHIEHTFCPTCGIQVYARGDSPDGPVVAVNCNTMDDVDPRALKSHFYDGAAM